ncbi:MAG: hypothetical protein C0502_09275 [Opitutus sp.]|nr:hypothetical protein [Opitutus sp.]
MHALPPFFINLVSASDLWTFVASNGALTAGRGDADQAIFPYATVDKIYDSVGHTGPCTMIRTHRAGEDVLWEPFAPHTGKVHRITRRLYKSVEGDRLWFEETNQELGLVFRQGWSTAEEHGLIRRCELINTGGQACTLRLIDSLLNLLPPGVSARLHAGSSCLADAYKTAELLPGSTLAVYSLAAAIIDRAIPLESLRATAVWSDGLPDPQVFLSATTLEQFHRGEPLAAAPGARGVRGTYAVASTLDLPPGGARRWMVVADTGLSQSEVVRRHAALVQGALPPAAGRGAEEATRRLRAIVAAADGLQCGGEEIISAHHFANVLFNVMRGGVFADAMRVAPQDFAACLRLHAVATADLHADWLRSLPATLDREELIASVATRSDATLARLAEEYLPLTFSRRHGDPSRPWNRFRIRLRDEHGRRVLAYEGNWRDIFQNWESLCLSYPGFIDSVVAKFLNASTADGYNPYRISHAGIDWEVPEHDDPWASIGYWGDHQVIYLQKLLEWSARCRPGVLRCALREPRYAYANVPYRIAPYADIRRNPRETIRFDSTLHRAITARETDLGSDARLLTGPDGRVLHVNLTEKLLLLALTRLTNFVAGGGIWMNTQRPEWNDANNALVGYGVSFVTLCYLRRLLAQMRDEWLPALGPSPVALSTHLGTLLRAVHGALQAHRAILTQPDATDLQRRTLLDALAQAGSDYRAALYRDGPGAPATVPPDEIATAIALALAFVEHSLRSGLRADGLYHSYSRLEFADESAALRIHPLYPMLEGQVAILSSGLLAPAEAVRLLRTLRASPLYRADQHSYLLYPDRTLPGFLERNVVPAARVAASPLLQALLTAGDRRILVRDETGRHRFDADLVNGDALRARLALLAREPRWSSLVAAHGPAVEETYEQVFHHRAFTGRSGTMFGYEGLGCIYWHMIAKLLLAVQENLLAAQTLGAPEAAPLADIYYDVRAGLGFNKSPAAYGAFPTDPYSHTPGHGGAQQPGMTGQVKEEILTRWGELGVRIADGTVGFRPTFLRAAEFTTAPAVFRVPRPDGAETALDLPAGALAFTVCGVPVIYRLSRGAPRLRWTRADGGSGEFPGTALDAGTSAQLFARSGTIARLDVDLGEAFRPL